jgi:hypothetical protein
MHPFHPVVMMESRPYLSQDCETPPLEAGDPLFRGEIATRPLGITPKNSYNGPAGVSGLDGTRSI